MKKTVLMLIAMLALMMVLAACGGADEPAAVEEPAVAADEAAAVEEPAMSYKMAAIFPGTITDADYNTLGYIGLTSVGTDLGIPVAYSENVAVPDVDGVMREYLDDDFNIIFTHGGQFVSQTKELAAEFPDVVQRLQAVYDAHLADIQSNRRPTAEMIRPAGALSAERPATKNAKKQRAR